MAVRRSESSSGGQDRSAGPDGIDDDGCRLESDLSYRAARLARRQRTLAERSRSSPSTTPSPSHCTNWLSSRDSRSRAIIRVRQRFKEDVVDRAKIWHMYFVSLSRASCADDQVVAAKTIPVRL